MPKKSVVKVMMLHRRRPESGRPDESTDRGASHPPDVGFSLVEVLVAVVLMGLGVVTVLGALGVSIQGSSIHQDKITALAALESASSSIKVQQDPCTVDAYQAVATSTLDPAWADRLVVQDLSGCGTDLHQVRLGVTAPGGLNQTLTVDVGGPRVADWGGGDEFDGGSGVVVSCAVTNLTATPSVMEVEAFRDEGLLTDDITVSVQTDADCSGTLRAFFTPPPVDPADVEWAPPADTNYQFTLPKGSFRWTVGDVGVEIVQEIHDSESGDLISSTPIGSKPDLMEIVPCEVSAVVDDPTPLRDVDGRLDGDLLISVTLSDACPTVDESQMSLSVNTGLEIHTQQLVGSGTSWEATILGQPDVGPVFEPGPTTIEISVLIGASPVPIATIPIEVQP